VLINAGTLKRGDAFVIYDQHGKIRSMKDFSGKDLKQALPSTPVQITGIPKLPQVGDILQVMKSEKIARRKAEEVQSIHHEDELNKRKKFSLATLKAKLAEGKLDQFKIIVKASTNGSLEAVKGEVEKLKTDKTIVKVVHSGVGEISDSDVMLAKTGDTIIVGFEVDASARIKKLADQESVSLMTFDVIYHLTEKLLEIIEGREDDQEEEKILGRFTVKAIFASNKKMAVLGGNVTEGLIRKSTKFRLLRESENEITQEKEMQVVGTGKIDTVQLGQQEKNEINEGTECGMKVTHKDLVFQEGDELELFIQKKN
jgi:translation initiation factor IF-2